MSGIAWQQDHVHPAPLPEHKRLSPPAVLASQLSHPTLSYFSPGGLAHGNREREVIERLLGALCIYWRCCHAVGCAFLAASSLLLAVCPVCAVGSGVFAFVSVSVVDDDAVQRRRRRRVRGAPRFLGRMGKFSSVLANNHTHVLRHSPSPHPASPLPHATGIWTTSAAVDTSVLQQTICVASLPTPRTLEHDASSSSLSLLWHCPSPLEGGKEGSHMFTF